ncbi:hypothetical protein WMY93_031582 [Mugilogobius chulae]|uniref:Uncharacterized protein n=1 Tax=Mugilogobius chulae TaxID=88201 RepID=A0AAW0ME99_9GOBI
MFSEFLEAFELRLFQVCVCVTHLPCVAAETRCASPRRPGVRRRGDRGVSAEDGSRLCLGQLRSLKDLNIWSDEDSEDVSLNGVFYCDKHQTHDGLYYCHRHRSWCFGSVLVLGRWSARII